MSSRKRRNSPISISEEIHSNKRAKLLSSLWVPREEVNIETTRKTQRREGIFCSTGASTRAKPKQYIVDWQNRHVTGEKYKSGRRQKGNIDHAVVVSRKEKNLSESFRRSSLLTHQRRREKSASLPASRKASVRAHSTGKERPQRTVEGSSSDKLDLGEGPVESSNQVSFTQALTPPKLIVLVSQHSSLDRDNHIRYQSSLSSTNITWSFLHNQDSGITESSPLSIKNLRPDKFEREVVIPDSQSLPGSSSYVPTPTTSTGNKSVTQPETGSCVVSTSSYTTSTNFSLSNPIPSHSPIQEPSDPIEDFTDLPLPESQDLGLHSSRSRSLPSGASSRFLKANHTRPGQICCSTSDPKTISHGKQSYTDRFYARPAEPVLSSSVRETLTFSDLDTQSPAPAELLGDINTSSEKDVDECLSHHTTQSQKSGINSPEAETGAQVQADLPPATHTTSTASVDDLWQSGQIVPKPVNSASQISSGSGNLVPENSGLVHASSDNTHLEVLARRRSVVPELFAISEDTGANSQITQATDSTILSQRDPNSQSRSHTRSVEDIKDFPLSSIESGDADIEKIPNSIISAFRHQYPHTLDSRAPPQPPSVSDSEMAEAPQTQTGLSSDVAPTPIMAAAPAGGSLRERLKNMRATSAAAFAANTAVLKANIEQSHSPRPDNEGTPLIIPEHSNTPEAPESRLEVQPMEVPVEVPLPMRISQPDPHTPNQPSKLSFHREVSYSQTITTLNPAHLGEMEFVIPLSMNTRVRDQYISTINYYQQAIEILMKDEIPDDGLVEQVREMLRRVNQVTTHVDLDNGDSMTQQQISAEDEAVWAENCSAKFQFLRHLFESIRDLDLHIGVVARPGRLLDIIETFLKGRYIVYNRPDTLTRSDWGTAKGRMEVSLIASGEEGAATLPKAANLIIALDGSFDARDVQVGILRTHLTMVGQLSPIIHLLVYNSAEHIERCLPTSLEPIDRMRKIVSCMTQTRHEVGLLLPDEPGSSAAAEEVAAFLEAGGLERDWAFPSIRPIEGIESLESLRDSESTHSDTQPIVDQNVASAPTTLKRALDNIEGTPAMQKRPRTTPTPAGEITHISDSATQHSSLTPSAQAVAELRTALRDARNEIAFTKNSFAEREKQLQNTITVTEGRLQDHIDSLSSLQFRYESLTRSSHLQRDSKISLLSNVTTLENKLERRAADVANLIIDRQRVEAELKDARKALLESPVPAVAELEGLRQEAKASAQQNAVQQKKIESLAKDFEFTRQQYQQASTSAVEIASHNAALEKEKITLTRRASGEATKLALINNDTEVRRHRARVAEIESLLADRDDLLRRKEDELRELKRGRAAGVQTRGSSVQPRSPRGPGSRGVSPAPVGMGGAGLLGVEMRRGGSGLRWGTG